MEYYAGIRTAKAQNEHSEIALQPISYDGTATWRKGADRGFQAFLEASRNMEIYDVETRSEVIHRGVFIEADAPAFNSPEECYQWSKDRARQMIDSGRFPTFFGGEHSISIGIIEAFKEHYGELSVLQLDAHADLRPEYGGSAYNHACALHAAARNTRLTQWGIRSLDRSELPFLDEKRCFFAQDIVKSKSLEYKALEQLRSPLYITIDLDVFDPSVMPATGTPEPGGLSWYEVTGFLKKVFEKHHVVGFDIVELAPIASRHDPQFLAAKLYYKMLSYRFEL